LIKQISDDFENNIIHHLRKAKKNVRIAVAWVNFELFYSIFSELADKNIIVEIVIDDNAFNLYRKNENYMERLQKKGIMIKQLYLKKGTMHRKFCIIDESYLLFGTYNWTKNASNFNIEDLNITDDIVMIKTYLNNFNFIKETNTNQLSALQTFERCPSCKGNKVNVLIFSPDTDKYSTTHTAVLKICDCSVEEISIEYIEGAFYFSFMSIREKYDYEYEYDTEQINERNELYYLDVEQFLKSTFENRYGITIHGVGIYHYEIMTKDGGGDYKVSILWKNKYAGKYLNNDYYNLNSFL